MCNGREKCFGLWPPAFPFSCCIYIYIDVIISDFNQVTKTELKWQTQKGEEERAEEGVEVVEVRGAEEGVDRDMEEVKGVERDAEEGKVVEVVEVGVVTRGEEEVADREGGDKVVIRAVEEDKLVVRDEVEADRAEEEGVEKIAVEVRGVEVEVVMDKTIKEEEHKLSQ